MEMRSGMKVVCIKDDLVWHGIRPLKNGQVYTIKNTKMCCGRLSLDVGTSSPAAGSMCAVCQYATSDGVWWFLSSRFRPLDFLDQQLEEIQSRPIEEPELQEA